MEFLDQYQKKDLVDELINSMKEYFERELTGQEILLIDQGVYTTCSVIEKMNRK